MMNLSMTCVFAIAGETNNGLPLWLWLIIILVVILLAGLIIWLISRSKGSSVPQPGPDMEKAKSESIEDEIHAEEPVKAVEIPVVEAEPPLIPADLTLIECIGPKVHSLLRDAGINTFAQLAAVDVAKLEEIINQAGLRMMDASTWPEQAKLAAEGKWDELKVLQDSLKGGRR